MPLRWLPAPLPLDPEGAARLLGPGEVERERVGARWALDVAGEARPSDPEGRITWRRDLVGRTTPEGLGPTQRVGVPPMLWERLLAAAGAARPAPEAIPVPGEAELAAPGSRRGRAREWFGLADTPGAQYRQELWAWGAATEDAETPSPRLCWAPGPAWRGAEGAVRLWRRAGLPPGRVEAGPGVLAAALEEAVEQVVPAEHFVEKDRLMVWCAVLLPFLAPTRAEAPPLRGPDEVLPDYRTLVAFHALHPRVQAALVLLDTLATALAADDHHTLRLLARALGPPAPGPRPGGGDAPRGGDAPQGGGATRGGAEAREEGVAAPGPEAEAAEADALVAAVGARLRAALSRRDAARDWDNGLGYLVFRKLIFEELDFSTADTFLATADLVFHAEVEGPPGQESRLGRLATRLRSTFKVGLTFPGEAKRRYPGGPAAAAAADLAWLKWTHPDFLATPP